MKLLIPPNQNENIRRQHPCNRDKRCINDAFFFYKNKINKKQLYSQILELGIKFVSRFENIRFEYHLTKQKPMLEWKLLAMLDENPEIVHSFDYEQYNHPLFRELFDIYLADFY